MKDLGSIFFKYRSYIPLPFVFLMLVFMEPTLTSIIIGFFIALSGELIRIWSVSFAGSETRTTSGVGGTYLVTQGPYSVIRNPLYAGNILIYIGIGIMSNALFPYLQIFAFLFFLFQYHCIVLAEEEFLQNKFTKIYSDYKKTVGRFIPKFTKLPDHIKSGLELNVKSGLRSERRSLQAFLITSSIIITYYLLKECFKVI
ncbi:MAG TPA: isoprenylcysteine carboxylmethyltransferase family protein [Ignavibacteria bacterium]|nr:isoprenylcysteine carboxylmethyltransferase family protein [Bacteroidota bacterium]HRI84074.1 isoprenylcysteine carboxylmethyltransferase family protein [Ignavibacteria bacterium]HRK00036.1 isoprenylcysteine carboxylmethyltransferase family protein [Ignavibacteria bacterium]